MYIAFLLSISLYGSINAQERHFPNYAFRFIQRTYFLLVRVVRGSELWISNAASSVSVKPLFEKWLRDFSEDSRIELRHVLSKIGKSREPPVVWGEKPFSISFSSCRKAHLNIWIRENALLMSNFKFMHYARQTPTMTPSGYSGKKPLSYRVKVIAVAFKAIKDNTNRLNWD